jgi:hypothetical protein
MRMPKPRDARHLLANRPKADDAERLVVELMHPRRWSVTAPAAVGNVAVLPDHATESRQHQHDGVFSD